jgi:membrane protease subunit (stomatin/prohibitin family)
MGIGSVLVGIAVTMVVLAYLARPFRGARANADLDQEIEAWVAQVRTEREKEQADTEAEARTACCPRCGHRAGPDDRFCARCGAQLGEGAG